MIEPHACEQPGTPCAFNKQRIQGEWFRARAMHVRELSGIADARLARDSLCDTAMAEATGPLATPTEQAAPVRYGVSASSMNSAILRRLQHQIVTARATVCRCSCFR